MSRPRAITRRCPPPQVKRGMTRGMQPHDGTGQLVLPVPPTAPRDWSTRPTRRLPAVQLPEMEVSE